MTEIVLGVVLVVLGAICVVVIERMRLPKGPTGVTGVGKIRGNGTNE